MSQKTNQFNLKLGMQQLLIQQTWLQISHPTPASALLTLLSTIEEICLILLQTLQD